MPNAPLAHSAPDEKSAPQSYSEHSSNVRELATSFADGISQYTRQLVHWDSLKRSTTVAGEWHDLGKLDPETQDALSKGRGSKLPHDHIDAGVAHVIEKGHEDFQAGWLIRAHHAPGLPSVVVENMRESFHLRGQRKHIDNDEFHRELVERNNKQLGNLVTLHQQEICNSVPPSNSPPTHGLPTRIALSCLVDADHSDTGRFDQEGQGEARLNPVKDPRWSDRLDALKSYISQLQLSPSKGDAARNQVRQELFDHCMSIEFEDDQTTIVTCEASVGLGKTTAVIGYLLRQAITLKLRRIVVVAPYTAILTQTAKTIRKALLLEDENADDIILEHHHRAEFSDPLLRASSALWDAPIILTTAVQFFETLGSNNPSKLRKLHRLPGSAIFIDEAHASLPIDLWPQCLEWLHELSQNWGCSTALVSGSLVKFWLHEWGKTKSSQIGNFPEISQPALVEQSKKFETQRVKFLEIKKPVTVLDLKDIIKKRLNIGRSQLIIFNTIHSAAGFADHLKNELDSTDFELTSSPVLHLSTALSPLDRAQILTEIQIRMNDEYHEPWVLVATSCVEAGIDLDFADGFREGCSVSSFIQTSGRINRHGKIEDSTLTSFTIADDPLLKTHPQFKMSSQVLKDLFPEIQTLEHSLSEIATAALQRELEMKAEMSPGKTLSEQENFHDYPAVADTCRVIKTDTCTVLVDEALALNLRKGIPVPFKDILNNSVQIWSNKITELGFETIKSPRGSTELYFASDASYDPQFLGIMKAQLQSKATIL